MGCNSEYMTANNYERELSKVACLLDEIAGKKWERSHWDGYHPSVYCKSRSEIGDIMVKRLCDALQSVDVSQYSLEMQMWWRDHQAADKARVKLEIEASKTESERMDALEKLTPHERKLLGLPATLPVP
jgi:hypothetical protein